MKYPLSFASHLAAQVLVLTLDLVAIWVLFRQVNTLGGWTSGQVIYLYCISGLAFGVSDLFVDSVSSTSQYVRLGTFDRFLMRPMSTLVQLMAQEFELRRVGRMIQPAIVLVVTLTRVPVDWTIARELLVPVSIVAGSLLFTGVTLIANSLSFFMPSTQEFANAFTYGGQTLAQYPVHLFGEWMRRISLFVVPVAVVAYLPGLFVLDAPNPLGIPRWMQESAPLSL